MYKQFVAWSCGGCSIAPLADYIDNSVYKELMEEQDYFKNTSDERIYLDQCWIFKRNGKVRTKRYKNKPVH